MIERKTIADLAQFLRTGQQGSATELLVCDTDGQDYPVLNIYMTDGRVCMDIDESLEVYDAEREREAEADTDNPKVCAVCGQEIAEVREAAASEGDV